MRIGMMLGFTVVLAACDLNLGERPATPRAGPAYEVALAASGPKGASAETAEQGEEIVLIVRGNDGRETAALIEGGASSIIESAAAQALLREAVDTVERHAPSAEEKAEAEAAPAKEGAVVRERVRVRLPGLSIEADKNEGESGRTKVAVGFGPSQVEVQAVDGAEHGVALVRLRGDAKMVRDFLQDQEGLSPEVRTQMLQALGLAEA